MITNETLASKCTAVVLDLILTGELHPGEQIKGEYLKNRLGIGLSPIREALSRLVSTNLVELTDNAGFKVSQIDSNRVHDLYKSYAKIETLLLREAIQNADEVWESLVVAALYQLSKVEGSGVKVIYKNWSAKNEEFHSALVGGCLLTGLKQIRRQVILVKNWYHNLAYSNLSNELIETSHLEHKKIAELAVSRKVDVACAMLYKHSMHNLDSLLSNLKTNGYLVDKI
jgi:GntR family transcriptional regulator, carbon starvation induced regulator